MNIGKKGERSRMVVEGKNNSTQRLRSFRTDKQLANIVHFKDYIFKTNNVSNILHSNGEGNGTHSVIFILKTHDRGSP